MIIEHKPPLTSVTQIKTDRELVPIYNITYVELEKEYFISFDITTFLKNEQHPVIFSFMVAVFKFDSINIENLIRANDTKMFNYLSKLYDFIPSEYHHKATVYCQIPKTVHNEQLYYQNLAEKGLNYSLECNLLLL